MTTTVKGIDQNIICSYLDEIGVTYNLEDGDLVVVQPGDSDFPHHVAVFIFVNNNRLSYVAGAHGFRPDGDIYRRVNDFNVAHKLPVAVVRDGELRMEYSFLLDEEVSKEYIIENCIKLVFGSIWLAFVDFAKPSSN